MLTEFPLPVLYSNNLLPSICFMTCTKNIPTCNVPIFTCSALELMLQMAKWGKTYMNIVDKCQKSNPKNQYFEKVSLWPNTSFPLNFWCSVAPLRDLLSSFEQCNSSHMFCFHCCSNYSEYINPNKACHLHYSKTQGLFSQ